MDTQRVNVGIIGGGASGVLFAINLKKHCDCNVTIYEAQNRILKKLLQTGNGMCNISNSNINSDMDVLSYYDNDIKNNINY